MATVLTKEGDVLDKIAFDALGDERHVVALRLANRHLEHFGSVLPAGLIIELPEIEAPDEAPTVRLWGTQ